MAKSYRVGIVGEANYQSTIAELRVGDIVRLVPERDNPHDPRAVSVRNGIDAPIGYLPRDHWLGAALLDEGKAFAASVHDLLIDVESRVPTGVVLGVGEGSADAQARSPARQLVQLSADEVNLIRRRRASGGCVFLLILLVAIGLCTPDVEHRQSSQANATAP